MKISDISIRRPVTTLTLTAALIFFGILGFMRMGIDLYPEVDFPIVTIKTILTGASPEVIDIDVTDVIEEQVKTISGIKSITSQSYESLSYITVEFELDKDVDVAAQEVRDKVNLAEQDLPDDVDKPVVAKFDIASQAIMWLAVSGNVEYSVLSHYADKVLKEQLQSVSGVGNIDPGGLRERQIRVWLDPNKLNARGLTAGDVVRAIGLKHIEMPGGRIETASQELSIRVLGEYTSVEELKRLVVARRDDSTIVLKDLGEITDGFEDMRSIIHFNGVPSIGLGVRKQSGTNTTEVAQAVRHKLEEVSRHAPARVTVEVAYDSSEFIRDSMRGVQFDIILGVLLTALTMYIFLKNIRTTFISIMAIPVSLIGAFMLMQSFGFTINNMTMLAMSLAVGLVIDDTIVVLENIFRHVEDGEEPMQAASTGTSEVGLAVIAATSSIAAVFIPVAFMEGIIGRFFYQFGLTVVLTILISVLISFTLTPFLSSRLIRHQKSHGKLYTSLENGLKAIEHVYRSLLTWSLSHRKTVVVIAIAAFAGGIALIPIIGTEMAPNADQGAFLVRFELPTGTSLDQTSLRLHEVEQFVFSQPEVDHSFSALGVGSGGEVNKGIMIVSLLPKNERETTQHKMMERVRDKLRSYPDMITAVEYMSAVGGGQRNSNINVVIKGPSVEALEPVSRKIITDMISSGIFTDVDTDLRLTKPDVKIHINRGLADDLNTAVRSISNEIYTLFGGVDAATFKEGGFRYDIQVKALPEYRTSPESLEHIPVRAADGTIIDAANLVNYEIGQGPNVINRFDRMRSATIFANVKDISVGEGFAKTMQIINNHLPKDGNWSTALGGESRAMQESFQSLANALIIAILIIYMILCIQFESFLHPFTMMLSLPLCMVGVFGALLLTGHTLNVMSFIGIILLMGIVTKNGILLVDFANQQREKGVDKIQAMITAGALRLRPIIMTALTVIVCVIPVALALSEGGESRAPMGVAVIGGVFSSTLLTLLVVPVVYIMLDNAKDRIHAWRTGRKPALISENFEGERQ